MRVLGEVAADRSPLPPEAPWPPAHREAISAPVDLEEMGEPNMMLFKFPHLPDLYLGETGIDDKDEEQVILEEDNVNHVGVIARQMESGRVAVPYKVGDEIDQAEHVSNMSVRVHGRAH